MIPRSVTLVAAIFGVASCLAAQDTRTVIEPFFPQLCTTLDAQLQSHGHTLAPEDEQKLDTARIQKAIDKCGKGRAVLLHVNETERCISERAAGIEDRCYADRRTRRDALRVARSRGFRGFAGKLRHCEPRRGQGLQAADFGGSRARLGDHGRRHD